MNKPLLVGAVSMAVMIASLVMFSIAYGRRENNNCSAVTVSIDMLSGITVAPWQITGQKACHVLEMLTTAPIIPSPAAVNLDAMGYRGLSVELTINKNIYRARIFNGKITGEIDKNTDTKQDNGRNLEVFLLQSGVSAGRVSPMLYEKIKEIYTSL